MERGTIEWNSGMMEWNSGMVERWNTGMKINHPVDQLSMRTIAIDIGMDARLPVS